MFPQNYILIRYSPFYHTRNLLKLYIVKVILKNANEVDALMLEGKELTILNFVHLHLS